MGWYKPSLKVRKLQAGTPCPGCGLLMHWGDMCAWSGEGTTIYIHVACASILLEAENGGSEGVQIWSEEEEID